MVTLIYPKDFVDINFHTINCIDVVNNYPGDYTDLNAGQLLLPGHPQPQKVEFNFIAPNLVRIHNKSNNMAQFSPHRPCILYESTSAWFTGEVLKIEDKLITSLPIPNALKNKLIDAGFKTPEDLIDDDSWKRLRGIGPVFTVVIEKALKAYRKDKEAYGS